MYDINNFKALPIIYKRIIKLLINMDDLLGFTLSIAIRYKLMISNIIASKTIIAVNFIYISPSQLIINKLQLRYNTRKARTIYFFLLATEGK
jgi:hypothetical protein